MKSILALAALSFSATLAHAQAVNCKDPQSTVEINECAGREFDAADKQLNTIYKRVMTEINKQIADKDETLSDLAKDQKSRLISSQRAWLAYRETDSTLQGIQMQGGSGETAVVVGTQTALTKARTKELKELFESENK